MKHVRKISNKTVANVSNLAHLVIRGRHREKLRLFDSLLHGIFISSRDLLLVWGMFKPLHYGASALGE